MRISLNKITNKYFIFFTPLIMINYYLIMRGINLNTFVILPAFFLFSVSSMKIAAMNSQCYFIKLLNIFIVYTLLTGFFYVFNDAPFDCFINGFKFFLFPAVFAYIGFKEKASDEFNKWYIYGCLFCFLIGLYLYFLVPDYYASFMLSSKEDAWHSEVGNANEDNIMRFSRFSSFFATSYAIQYFGVPALIISLTYSMRKNVSINNIVLIITALISFIVCLLCQQRMAMAWAFFVPIFLGVYYGKRGNFSILKVVVSCTIIIAVCSSYVLYLDRYIDVANMVLGKFEQMNFLEAMSSRTEQFKSFSRVTPFSMIFGLGLGSCSTIAGAFGLDAVYDSEFPKIFYELGLVGLSLFSLLMIVSIVRGLKNFKYLHMEMLIVLFFLVAGIGSDSLTFFIYDIMFWYSLGRLWNKQLLM